MGLSKIASEETLAWYRAAELKHSRVAMAAATGWAYVASGGPLFPGYLSIEQGVTFESLGRDGYAAWDAVPDSGKLQIIGVVGILDLLGTRHRGSQQRRARRKRRGFRVAAGWPRRCGGVPSPPVPPDCAAACAAARAAAGRRPAFSPLRRAAGEAAVKPHYMMGGTPGKIPLLWDPLGFTKSLSPELLARKRTAELKNGCAQPAAHQRHREGRRRRMAVSRRRRVGPAAAAAAACLKPCASPFPPADADLPRTVARGPAAWFAAASP